MTQHNYDIIIIGGGIAGLLATSAFAQTGFRVICVDPAPPITQASDAGADQRSTAFLQPARQFMQDAGIWQVLAPHAEPLNIMRIIDAGDKNPDNFVVKEFAASDISDLPFGWNFPNWLLRQVLLAQIESLDTAHFLPGRRAVGFLSRLNYARVTLDDGTKLQAALVLGADGRGSFMRQAANINVDTIRYGQKALAFSVTHDVPHENISTEIHQSGGPFTLVPLPDENGKHRSAVVWMESGPRANALAALDEDAFNQELNARACGVLGALKLTTPRAVWPIISQSARQLYAGRLALVAEAAHVVPPIGAQGLNMSLADMSCLWRLAQSHKGDLGNPHMMAAYEKARKFDVHMRVLGIAALNMASIGPSQAIKDARKIGLNLLHGIKPVRKGLMQLGLGAR